MTLMHYLSLAAILFGIGFYGVLTRRNAIAVLMSLELMFNAVTINLIAFNRYVIPFRLEEFGMRMGFSGSSAFMTPDGYIGQIFAIFVIAIAAAEATVGLAIVILIYRRWRGIDIDRVNLLKW